MNGVLSDLGWIRYTDKFPVIDGQLNADYLGENSVGELKIFEEEGLLKKERQNKIAELMKAYCDENKLVDLNVESLPREVRSQFENLISKPFQTAIKKASKQMKQTAIFANKTGDRVVFAVNNGFSYLDADSFERIFISRCKRDSRSIDYAACVTVDYHQGDFDAYVFCTTRVHKINNALKWECEDEFIDSVGKHFDVGMTQMMRDQMNPELWKNNLPAVQSICFERDGITYLREAPRVPDSRFNP
jgi:hypothetical protein